MTSSRDDIAGVDDAAFADGTPSSPNGPPRHPDLFTAEEAAVYLRLEGPRSIQRLRQEGRLEPLDMGRRNLYHRADLDAFVDSLRHRPASQGREKTPPSQRSNASAPGRGLASPGRERKLHLSSNRETPH